MSESSHAAASSVQPDDSLVSSGIGYIMGAADMGGEEEDRATSGTKSLTYSAITATTGQQSTIQGASPAVGASGSVAGTIPGKPPLLIKGQKNVGPYASPVRSPIRRSPNTTPPERRRRILRRGRRIRVALTNPRVKRTRFHRVASGQCAGRQGPINIRCRFPQHLGQDQTPRFRGRS